MSPSEREVHQHNVLYVILYDIHLTQIIYEFIHFRAAEVLEREKLLSAGVANSVTPHDLLQPNSDFHIRNRYLSRIGAPVSILFTINLKIVLKLILQLPSNYDINMKGIAFRALR